MAPSTVRARLLPPWAAALAVLATAACGGPASTSGAPDVPASSAPAAVVDGAGAPPAAPCSGAPAPAAFQHVVWIWMENKPDTEVLGSAEAPYTTSLARSCASATDYHGVRHPSLPNYIAATSGSTHAITDDDAPSAHPLPGASLFGQVTASGREWRSYEESMPGTCALDADGDYAVKHNPAAYYTDVRSQCRRWDVPLDDLATDARDDRLPAFALVTPNMCHDTHDCPVGTGDAWLRQVVPSILDSPSYRAGTTAVVLTYDEDDDHHGNRIPLVVLAPSVAPGSTIPGRHDHYSLLRTTEDLLGLEHLGAAAEATPLPGL